MCFSIPYKVLRVNKDKVLLEGGRRVNIGREIKVKSGEYLQIVGDVAVGKLSKKEGLKIRRLIKRLN